MSNTSVRVLWEAIPDYCPGIDIQMEADTVPGLKSVPEAAHTIRHGSADFTVLVNPSNLVAPSGIYGLLRQLRKEGRPIIAWITDDPEHFDFHYALAPMVDLLFTSDANAHLYYHAANVRYLPPATSHSSLQIPMPFFKLNEARQEKPETPLFDIYFSPECLKRESGRSLLSALEANAPAGVAVTTEAAACTSAKVQIVYPLPPDNDANRMFEVVPSTPDFWFLGTAEEGQCQLVFLRQPEIQDFFPPDALPTFDNSASLKEALAYLFTDENWRTVGQRAQTVVREKHLWRHRWQTILDTMRQEGLL